jgi:hypothetical protein
MSSSVEYTESFTLEFHELSRLRRGSMCLVRGMSLCESATGVDNSRWVLAGCPLVPRLPMLL